MVTDAVFAYGAHDFVSRHVAHAKNNSIFQYLYTHEGKFRVFVPKEISLLCFFISRNNILLTSIYYQGQKSMLMDAIETITVPYGVCHADEMYMLFDPYLVDWIPEEGLNAADSKVSNTIVKLWKNFIKTGNPTTTGKTNILR